MIKKINIILLCLIYFYAGYFYSHVYEKPKYLGGVLRDDGWLIIQIKPRIPIPYFRFFKTIRIDDYFIDVKYTNYLREQCCNRIFYCE